MSINFNKPKLKVRKESEKMKKLIALLLALVLVFSFAACASSNGDDKDAEDKKDATDDVIDDKSNTDGEPTPVTIGFSLSSNDETMQQFKSDIENKWKAQKEEQYNVTLEILWADASGDVAQQISDVENFVAQGADVISIRMCDMDGSAPAAEYAASQGVPVLAAWWDINTDATIGTLKVVDNTYCGELMANWLIDYAEKNNVDLKVGVLYGKQAVPESNKRAIRFEEILTEKYGDTTSGQVSIVVKDYGEQSTDTAMTLVENWMQQYGDELNCIFACMDDMAYGAIQVLNSLGVRDKFVVIGCNGNKYLYLVGEDDGFDMTIKLDNLASIGMELDVLICAALGLDDQMPNLDSANTDGMIVVDKDNFEEMWAKYGTN